MKIFSIVLSFAVLAVLLCVPVLGASQGWTEIQMSFDNYLYRFNNDPEDISPDEIAGTVQGASLQWTLSASGSRNTYAIRSSDNLISVKKGDVVTIPYISGGFGGWFGGGSANSGTVSFALFACDSSGVPLATSSGAPVILAPVELWGTITGGSTWNYTPANAITLKVTQDAEYAFVGFNLQFVAPNDFNFSMNNTKSFTIGYGNPNSPERPQYRPPNTGDIGGYTEKEQEVFGNISGGLDHADNALAVPDMGFFSGLTALILIYDVIVPGIPFMRTLLSFSLAVGLFGFVCNIVPGAIARAVDSKKGGKKK